MLSIESPHRPYLPHCTQRKENSDRGRHAEEYLTTKRTNDGSQKRKIESTYSDLYDRKVTKTKKISDIPRCYKEDLTLYQLAESRKFDSEKNFLHALHALEACYDEKNSRFFDNRAYISVSNLSNEFSTYLHKYKTDYINQKKVFDTQHKIFQESQIYQFIINLNPFNINIFHSMATLALTIGQELKAQKTGQQNAAMPYFDLALYYLEPIKHTEKSIRTCILIHKEKGNYKSVKELSIQYLGNPHNIPSKNYEEHKKELSMNLLHALVKLKEHAFLHDMIKPVIGAEKTIALLGKEYSKKEYNVNQQTSAPISIRVSEEEVLDIFAYKSSQLITQIVAIFIKDDRKKNEALLKLILAKFNLIDKCAKNFIDAVSFIKKPDRCEITLCLFRLLAKFGLFEEIDGYMDELLLITPVSSPFMTPLLIAEILDREQLYATTSDSPLRYAYIKFEHTLRTSIALQNLSPSSEKKEPQNEALKGNAYQFPDIGQIRAGMNHLKQAWSQKYPRRLPPTRWNYSS